MRSRMNRKSWPGVIWLVALMFLLIGCPPLGQLGGGNTPEEILMDALMNSVDFSFESITADIDIQPGRGLIPIPTIDLVFDVGIGVTNNSLIPLLAKAVDVHLFTQETEFGAARMSPTDALATTSVIHDLSIPRGEKRIVPLNIQVPVEKVGMELVNLINGGSLFYRIDAMFDFSYQGVTVPFEVTLDEGNSW